mmetsp:Transcript_42906/g.132916  ORF Transcript_42906/g.132916 Transcript_42906/m.132916 type:complete len:214 (+) Transcript_42906:688-1329(+)
MVHPGAAAARPQRPELVRARAGLELEPVRLHPCPDLPRRPHPEGDQGPQPLLRSDPAHRPHGAHPPDHPGDALLPEPAADGLFHHALNAVLAVGLHIAALCDVHVLHLHPVHPAGLLQGQGGLPKPHLGRLLLDDARAVLQHDIHRSDLALHGDLRREGLARALRAPPGGEHLLRAHLHFLRLLRGLRCAEHGHRRLRRQHAVGLAAGPGRRH